MKAKFFLRNCLVSRFDEPDMRHLRASEARRIKTYVERGSKVNAVEMAVKVRDNKQFLKEALAQAEIANQKDEVPVGAVIVDDGKIIAFAHNQNRSICDPTAHAEILVLREAAKIKKTSRLDGCEIYVTLEPCAMCASAIALARIKRVYYCLPDKKFGAVESGARIFNSTSCHHKPEVYSGFFEEESKKLLLDFFKTKRQS